MSKLKINKTKNHNFATKQLHFTTDYTIFNRIPTNRGKDSGLDAKKVKTLKDKYKDGDFVLDAMKVIVNLDMVTCDGTHTIEMCRELNIPVMFIVTDDPILNPNTKSDVKYLQHMMKGLSKINDHNPTWSTLDNFRGALESQCKLAVIMDETMDEISRKGKISKHLLRPNHIYALIKQQSTYFSAGDKAKVEDYLNKKDIAFTKTMFYDNNVSFYTKSICHLRRLFNGLSLNKVLKIVFTFYWENKFDANRFLECLELTNYVDIKGTSLDEIKVMIQNLYNFKYVSGRKTRTNKLF